MRVAVVAGPGRTALLQELAEDGSGYAAPTLVNDFPAAVAAYERAGPGRGDRAPREPVPREPVPREPVPREPVPREPVRWVWADTSAVYPSLLRAGVQVDRCHDVALTGALLLARDGQQARSGNRSYPAARPGARSCRAGDPVRAGRTGIRRRPRGAHRPGRRAHGADAADRPWTRIRAGSGCWPRPNRPGAWPPRR